MTGLDSIVKVYFAVQGVRRGMLEEEEEPVQPNTICDVCKTPISEDEKVNGKPIRMTDGEPICLQCHQDIEGLHRELG